ncbi:MAG TPA: hypothetical protein VMA36_19460 [Candidatus Limnocylindria bacterium]|jgi:hypothetical protein|nr:hypothetical protein [Candidatus Limnocylindria bacterium]
MRRVALAPFAALALVAATPPPNAGSHAPSLTIVCQATPFYAFPSGQNVPQRIAGPQATLGQRFRLVSGPRTTLESLQYYETDVPVNQPGYPSDARSWVRSDCAQPSS